LSGNTVSGNIDNMNPEQFPPKDPKKDAEMIDALIHDELEEKGGEYVQGKSKDEVLGEDGVVDEDEDEDDGQLEPWQKEDTSEKWKGDQEEGLYRHIGKRDPSLELYKVLQNNFPMLGVEIRKDVIDKEGKYRPDYVDIYIDKEKGYKELVRSLEDHPIIDLLCAPFGYRSAFDMQLSKVRSLSVMPEAMLQRIRTRYLYLDYEYHKDFASKETLDGMFKEIVKIESPLNKYMKDEELHLLLESIIKEELQARDINN
jgi:hypothetical protein